MTTENFTALKEYYNLWLECGEETYAELAFTEEFSRNFGGLVNASLAMQQPLAGFTPPLPPGFAELADAVPVDVGPSARDEVYREDRIRLYRYRPLVAEPHAVPVLIVYALVNRPYIMDLQDGRSLVQGLLNTGLDVYLLDWGYPDADDKALTLDDYINRYLGNSVDFVRQHSGAQRLNLLGVCQGGTFCLCYTALHQQKVANLVTSVTPVDFHTRRDLLSHLARHVDIDLCVDTLGNMPGEYLNWLFLMLKPYRLTGKKYLDALDILDDEDKLATFMRMEKWIFDSPDQAGEAFRQFAKGLLPAKQAGEGGGAYRRQQGRPGADHHTGPEHLRRQRPPGAARCVKSPGRLHQQRGLHRTGTARRPHRHLRRRRRPGHPARRHQRLVERALTSSYLLAQERRVIHNHSP